MLIYSYLTLYKSGQGLMLKLRIKTTMLNLEKIFSRKKGQRRVAEFMLSNAIRVSEDDRILMGEIEIFHSSIARILGVDRRLIGETVNTILKNQELKKIFLRLNSTLLLRDVAPELGFGAIEIIPEDAASRGIIAGVSRIIADAGISIRQITTDDPMFRNAGMSIVTEKPLPRELIDEILKLPPVKKVIVLS